MLAQVDEVTAGQGKVIPSSKAQLIQAAEPATIQELLVRSGQRVQRGQLLARLDNPQSRPDPGRDRGAPGALGAARAEGTGGSGSALARRGSDAERRAPPGAVEPGRARSMRRPTSAAAKRPKRRRRSAACSAAWRWPSSRSQMLEPLAAKNIVPQTDLLDARREVIDLQGRIAAAREQQARAAPRSARRRPGERSQLQLPPGSAQRAQPGQAEDRRQRAVAARRAGRLAGSNCARRSTASSTTSR